METRNFKTSFNLQRVREDSGLMKLFMFPNGFSNLSNSRFFRSLIGWIQAIKLRKNENSIGWKRFGSFISLHLAYRRKSVCFISFYEAKHFFFQKKKTLKFNAPNSFFENESNFFYIISDFFNKFLKTWVKEERRLDLEDRI